MSEHNALAEAAVEVSKAGGPDAGELRAVGEAHFRRTRETSDRFFVERSEDVSRACKDMAERFHRGGRLLVFGGPGPVLSDAYHVSVEFVHPVLVGKRALPATVLETRPAEEIRVLARPEDIALGITFDGDHGETVDGLRAGVEAGLLTLGLAGREGGRMAEIGTDHLFVIPAGDPTVVQEVQETLYHVLWELVHVFFDHRGLS